LTKLNLSDLSGAKPAVSELYSYDAVNRVISVERHEIVSHFF
jgi:hypothetical protein